MEKQRLRAYYGVMENKFQEICNVKLKNLRANWSCLVKILETRLDNLVYRLGFASSIRQARQMVVQWTYSCKW